MRPFEERAGALIAAAFFAVGVALGGDVGATADERETLESALRNVEILAAAMRGESPPEWSFHEITGFYFVVDTARGLWVSAAQALGVRDALRAMHAANLLMASLTLWLLYRVARLAGGSARTATLATLTLALLPKFVAHAQNNPKDLPATFAVTLALHGLLAVANTTRTRDVLAAGLALGLALTTRVHALFTLPIAGLWLAITRDRFSGRDVAAALGTLGVAALAVVAFWPWLWAAPLDNLTIAMSKLSSKVFTMPVLYLGTVYSADQIPWHYRSVQFLATTPLLVTALGALGAASLFRSALATGERHLALLGTLWTVVYFGADALVFSRYDVLRHFLVALPGVALLVAAGANALLAAARGATLGRAIVGLALASSAAGIATTWPYANAYLNGVSRALCDGDCDRTFEIEYWGQTHLEASRWLRRNASPGSEVIDPMFGHVAAAYLDGSEIPVREGGVRDWAPRERERYLLLISRRAWWTEPLEEVARTRTPVFEIRRSGGRLLAIYSNASGGADVPGD